MLKFLNGRWLFCQLMDAAADPKGGGGGNTPAPKENAPDLAGQLAEQNKKNEALEARLAKLEGKGTTPNEDPSLADKSRNLIELAEKQKLDEKKLESALSFNLKAVEWVKDNASLLPKSIQGIFDQAAKEKYENAIEKDSAIKAAIVQEFFSLQANLELLTPTLKSTLEDFTKLTKNVKQERAQSIYDTVFEPTFEMLKRIKKAEQLNKGVADPTDSENAYKNKLISGSRKHYLGEK